MYWQFELAAFCLICFCKPAKNHTPESRKNEKRHGDCKKKIQYVEMFQKQDSRDVSDLGKVNISSRLKFIQDSNCANHPFFIFLQTQNGGVGGRRRKPVLQNKADS